VGTVFDTTNPGEYPTNFNDTLCVSLGGAKSDYAGNAGTYWGGSNNAHSSTCTVNPACSCPLTYATYTSLPTNPTTKTVAQWFAAQYQYGNTGAFFPANPFAIRQIPDGLTKTYLVGEKSLQPQQYDSAGLNANSRSYGDDNTMYRGYDYDNVRFASNYAGGTPAGPGLPTVPTEAQIAADTTGATYYPPVQDTNDPLGTSDPNFFTYYINNFGAAHPAGCQFAMCDGSVQTISYTVDRLVHWELANRQDGMDVSIP
jgi:hypothetical protein